MPGEIILLCHATASLYITWSAKATVRESTVWFPVAHLRFSSGGWRSELFCAPRLSIFIHFCESYSLTCSGYWSLVKNHCFRRIVVKTTKMKKKKMIFVFAVKLTGFFLNFLAVFQLQLKNYIMSNKLFNRVYYHLHTIFGLLIVFFFFKNLSTFPNSSEQDILRYT